jgi:mono/diheme cytochrome c family protein
VFARKYYKQRYVVIALLVGLLLASLAWQWGSSSRAYIDPFKDVGRVALGKTLYDNNCAACHGANLEGQPNWRIRLANGRLPAPPHDKTGHTWHHPDALLIDLIKNGLVPGRTAPKGYVSDMPAYNNLLSDNEIRAVLAYMKSTWPDEVIQAQKEVTLKSDH